MTTNELFTYYERLKEWKQTIPPMPTATIYPGVLSHRSALVVAGGGISLGNETNKVAIFKPGALQWYSTLPLPTACRSMSLSYIGDTCYALAGYVYPSSLNQALYASVDDLLHAAVPANQTTHSGSSLSDTQTAWKTLPNTPNYRSNPAVLAGNLLSIGGKETSQGGSIMKEVYVYSTSTKSWISFGDLPEPRSHTTVAVLSSTEILVVGGWCDGRVNTVYKGELCIK